MRTLFSTSMRAAVVGLILVAPIALGQPTAAFAGQNSTSDDKLKDRIDYRLETSPVVKKYDLHVKVNAGVAMLKGTVATDAQKAEAGTLAKITGVTRESTIRSRSTRTPTRRWRIARRPACAAAAKRSRTRGSRPR